jgi:hypothetical protein
MAEFLEHTGTCGCRVATTRGRLHGLVVVSLLLVPLNAVGALVPDGQVEAYSAAEWNGSVVVRTGGLPPWDLVALDLDSGQATPLRVPGLDEVTDVSTFRGQPVALGLVSGRRVLLVLKSGRWQRLTVPSGLGPSGGILISGSEQWLVLLERQRGVVHWTANTAWRTQRLGLPVHGTIHLAVVQDRLFVGHERGEFGGGLVALDLQTGTSVAVLPMSQCTTPVKALERGADGHLWVVQGQCAMDDRRGRVLVLQGTTWKTVASSDASATTSAPVEGGGRCGDAPFDLSNINWSFEPAAFSGLSFDERGRPVVLTHPVGLVRLEGGRWRRLVDPWTLAPESGCWNFVKLIGRHAVLGTPGQGMAILDFESGRTSPRVRGVELPTTASYLQAAEELSSAEKGRLRATRLEGEVLPALAAAIRDYSAILENRRTHGARVSLEDYRLSIMRLKDGVSVEFRRRGAQGASGGATYWLRPPYIHPLIRTLWR